MVGCFQRKSTGRNVVAEEKTGIFRQKSTDDYVVLWRGQEVCRYRSIKEFVEAHVEGLQALEENQAELLDHYYRTLR
jgi:hypothetical protein